MGMVPTMGKYKTGTLEKVKTAKGWTWYLRYTDSTGAKSVRPRVRIGLVSEFPTKGAANRAAEGVRRRLNGPVEGRKTFGDVLNRYEAEEAPKRHSTRRGYLSMINAHIRPKWESVAIADVRAFEVRTWLMGLDCGSRRKGHLHGMMRILFRFAMLWEWCPAGENPMRLFSLEGATKRAKTPGILTHHQFHDLLENIPEEPYRTMVIAAQCLGLRVSELMALRWADLDYLGETVNISKAIVEGRLGEVKTYQSARKLPLDLRLAQVFQAWRSITEFKDPEHFIFASPWQAGDLPYNASKIQSKILRAAGKAIGLTFSLGWHSFRHTYRALLRQSGAAMDVQRDLMRHADIHTTMQVYGATGIDELRKVNDEVVDGLFGERKQ